MFHWSPIRLSEHRSEKENYCFIEFVLQDLEAKIQRICIKLMIWHTNHLKTPIFLPNTIFIVFLVLKNTKLKTTLTCLEHELHKWIFILSDLHQIKITAAQRNKQKKIWACRDVTASRTYMCMYILLLLFELTFYSHKEKDLTDSNSSLAAIIDNNYVLTVL